MHDGGGANPERITIVTPGIYHLSACVAFAASAVGMRSLAIWLGGVTMIASIDAMAITTGGFYTTLAVCCDYALTAGQFVELQVFQNTGGNLNALYLAAASPFFSAHLVSA
jgi:hypothetical protein